MDEIHFVCKNKATGELYEIVVPVARELVEARLRILDMVLASSSPEAMMREYGPDKRGSLPFQCGYCSFVEECYKNAGLVNVSRNKYKIVS